MVSCGISCPICSNHWARSSTFPGRCSRHLIISQTCSIEEKSGHLAGQGSVWQALSSVKAQVIGGVAVDESRFNLWDHDGRIRVRRYAGERCLPEWVIERHSGLTPGVMQDNARPQVAKTVLDFSSSQHMQLLSWPAYSLDMSPIEHLWDLVGRRLARDPLPAASKDEQAIGNSLPQAYIQNLFDSIAALKY
ncbi:transposable element Tcb2 transposase [Trichonephila clavipes]|nr:transposable element Tcb2 transposase [Trichonephila clavipes]